MPRRFAIHPPYLVDRIRIRPDGGDVELQKSLNQVFQELHRWIRYQRDGSDGDQVSLTNIEIALGVLQPSITPIGPGASPYPVQPDDRILLVDASAGAFTVLLPTNVQSKNRILTVKKIDTSDYDVTLDGSASGALIDGDADFDLECEDESVDIICDGTDWWIL